MALHVTTGPAPQPTTTSEKTTKQVSLDDQIISLSKEYGVNSVLAKRIMGCETLGSPTAEPDPTKFRLNYTSRGVVWSKDVGYWQINDFYWKTYLKTKLNLDIDKPADNLKAGFWILQHYGSKPWLWSQKCWQNK